MKAAIYASMLLAVFALLTALTARAGEYDDTTMNQVSVGLQAGGQAFSQIIFFADQRQALSQRRAQAVQSALLERGVSASQISSVGKGETTPVASNDTASGRQANRRVELIFSQDASRVATDSQ